MEDFVKRNKEKGGEEEKKLGNESKVTKRSQVEREDKRVDKKTNRGGKGS